MASDQPVAERVVGAVLRELWRRGGEVAIRDLEAAAGASLREVQQALARLAAEGCRIERTPSGAHMMAAGLGWWREILEYEAQQRGMRIGRRVMVYQRTGSTNDVAWQCAADATADGLVVLADEQTAGRGRLGHVWHSKPGQSILLSVLLAGTGPPEVERLTLLAGLAAARALERCVSASGAARSGGWRAQIKWPNDILAAGKKLAGVLVERRAGAAVAGIGINVAQAAADFPPDVAPAATSLYQVTGVLADRLRVAAALLAELDACLAPRTDAPRHEAQWLAEWKSRCPMLGTHVRVRVAERETTGHVVDVAPLQGLVLRDDGGATHFFSAQTASLGN